MLENFLKLKGAQELSKTEQFEVNGGRKSIQSICLSPYLTETQTCQPGYHLHPMGHCICCRDI